MKIEHRTFEVSVPTLDGKAVAERVPIEIPMEWDENVGEWLMTEAGSQKVEETKARHMGLLLPTELLALRNRLGLTQKEIGALLQIGEKTWTRWERGNGRPSRSVNLLLRAIHDQEITIDYLQRASENRVGWRKVIPFPNKRPAIHMDNLYRSESGVKIISKNVRAS